MLDHVPPTKVKGLLKGLKYISQIFDGEKEHEMVIGNPTDVKHVAHIGCDGPAINNTPSWMNGFHSAPLSTSSSGQDGKELVSPKPTSQEIPLGGITGSPSRDYIGSPKPRRTRRHVSAAAPESASESSSRVSRHARSEAPGSDSPARDRSSRGSRHGSSEAPGSDSPSRDSSSRGSRHSHRHQSTGSVPGSESPHQEGSGPRRSRRLPKPDSLIGPESESLACDLPSIPKQEKKKERRSKTSDTGSNRSSTRSKNSSEEGIAQPTMVEETV